MSRAFMQSLPKEGGGRFIELVLDLQFERDARRRLLQEARSRPLTEWESEALAQAFDDSWFERLYLDNFLEACGDFVHEIASSLPAPSWASGDRQSTSMARYWRWGLWEDCMGNVPDQVERCLQALCATAFDEGLRIADLDRVWPMRGGA